MSYRYGPNGLPISEISMVPCPDGVLVVIAPYTTFTITPHPSGIEGLPPMALVDGQTLRVPPEKVRQLVDARRILDPATGEMKPDDPPPPPAPPPRLGITYYGSQEAALEKYDRELEAEKAKQKGGYGYDRERRVRPRITGSFDPLGPIQGVDY